MHIDPWIVVFGFGVGVLVGLTGVGGGSLMTPMLILVFGISPVTAIGTDLAYGAVTKTLGGWRHWRQRTVDLGLSLWMAVGAVPSAVGGVVALKALQHGDKTSFDDTILIALGGTLLLCGAAMLFRLLLHPGGKNEHERAVLTPAKRAMAIVFGVVFGFVIGVTSVGSGSLITVVLILVFGLGPRQVVSTSVYFAAILLWAAALAHLVAGDINYTLVGTILIGSLPGVWIGSSLSPRVPAGALRVALGLLLVGAGLALVQKAGANIPIAVIGAFPIVVGAFMAAAWLRGRARARVVASAPESSAATSSAATASAAAPPAAARVEPAALIH